MREAWVVFANGTLREPVLLGIELLMISTSSRFGEDVGTFLRALFLQKHRKDLRLESAAPLMPPSSELTYLVSPIPGL